METALLCPWESPVYLIFSSNAYPLFYYAHLVPILIGGVLLGVLWVDNSRMLAIRMLTIVFGIATAWILVDLVSTASNRPDVVTFIWSFQVLIEPMIYAAALFLFYVFVFRKFPSFPEQLAVTILLTPLIILAPTAFNVVGVYLDECIAAEGFLASHYSYGVEIFLTLWILIVAARTIFRTRDPIERRKIILFLVGLMAFLISFASGNLIGSLTGDWVTAQYGLFGIPVFTAFLGYLIVRFRAFDIKIFAAQALVVAVSILVFSMLFLKSIENVRIITVITFFLSSTLGWFLIRSVRKEIEQREHIEELAKNLRQANERLKELDKLKSQFLSIASHDLRAPLTAIRNFMSLMLDGTYGKIPTSAEEGMRQVFERSTEMAKSVDNYLNVSRIEQGRMQYDFANVDIVKLISDIATSFKSLAEQKGLVFSFKGPADLKPITVRADAPKMNEVMNLLIDNSIKYTPKGNIQINIETTENKKRVRITLKDTGVGMSKDTIETKLFKMFSTAEDSRKTNISSTGVGLYVVKAHVEAHQGRVWAESEGEGKGSTFIIELPILNK